MSVFDDGATVDRFAELIVGLGANIQPGQLVRVSSEIGKETVTRAIAREAYRAGAKFVDVAYFDMHVKHARVALAAPDTLQYVPPYMGEALLAVGAAHGSVITLTGPAFPGLMEDLDPNLAGRDQLPRIRESMLLVNARALNWTVAPVPTRNWAQYVHPELDADEAWARLGSEIAHIARLDTDDPVAAWRARIDALTRVATRLTERHLDRIHFRGPGTDLTVGLLKGSRWLAGAFTTAEGIDHMPNLPTEEVFTAPDPLRVDGVVRATKPLVLGGSVIEGLEVEFKDGRAIRIDADQGADVLRTYTVRDPGAARLGELALVDGDGRIGPLNTVFFDTLLDENAASHIALGAAYAFTADDNERELINKSEIHVDFMIGSPEVQVSAVTAAGEELPILQGGQWRI
jgi:aminopeptidase